MKKLTMEVTKKLIKDVKKMKRDDILTLIEEYQLDLGMDEDDLDELTDKDLKIALIDELEITLEELEDDNEDLEEEETDEQNEEDVADDTEEEEETDEQNEEDVADDTEEEEETDEQNEEDVADDTEEEKAVEDVKPTKAPKAPKKEKTNLEKRQTARKTNKNPNKQPRPHQKVDNGHAIELIPNDDALFPCYPIIEQKPLKILQSDIKVDIKINNHNIIALDDGKYITFAFNGQWYTVNRKYIKFGKDLINYEIGFFNQNIAPLINEIKAGKQVKTDYTYQQKPEKEVKVKKVNLEDKTVEEVKKEVKVPAPEVKEEVKKDVEALPKGAKKVVKKILKKKA